MKEKAISRQISIQTLSIIFSEILGDKFLDYYLIHLGGFAFDLLAGFLLNFEKTRRIGFLLSCLFHGLNSQLFDIGSPDPRPPEKHQFKLI